MPPHKAIPSRAQHAPTISPPNVLELFVAEPPWAEVDLSGQDGTRVSVQAVSHEEVDHFENTDESPTQRGRQRTPARSVQLLPPPGLLTHAPLAPAPTEIPLVCHGITLHPTIARSLRRSEPILLHWIAQNSPPPWVDDKMMRLFVSAQDLKLLYTLPEALHDEMFVVTLELDRLVSMARNAMLHRDRGSRPTGGLNLARQLDAIRHAYHEDAEALGYCTTVLFNAVTCSKFLARALQEALKSKNLRASDPRDAAAPPYWAALYKATHQSFTGYQRAIRDLKHWRGQLDRHIQDVCLATPRARAERPFVPQVLPRVVGYIQPLRVSTPTALEAVTNHLREQRNSAEWLESKVMSTIQSLEEGIVEIKTRWASVVDSTGPRALFGGSAWRH